MSNGFLRPGFVASEKISPTVSRSEPGASCGARADVAVGRVAGLGAAREALARRDVGVLVVAQQQPQAPARSGAQYCAWPFGPITRS